MVKCICLRSQMKSILTTHQENEDYSGFSQIYEEDDDSGSDTGYKVYVWRQKEESIDHDTPPSLFERQLPRKRQQVNATQGKKHPIVQTAPASLVFYRSNTVVMARRPPHYGRQEPVYGASPTSPEYKQDCEHIMELLDDRVTVPQGPVHIPRISAAPFDPKVLKKRTRKPPDAPSSSSSLSLYEGGEDDDIYEGFRPELLSFEDNDLQPAKECSLKYVRSQNSTST